jgi:hypothetical protein
LSSSKRDCLKELFRGGSIGMCSSLWRLYTGYPSLSLRL